MTKRNDIANRVSLPGLLACLILLALIPSPALAAEPCPNEQLRQESRINPATGQPYSAQLAGCRAYELVSPPDSKGFEVPSSHFLPEVSHAITPSGSVFYMSTATPAGTGAVEDGQFQDVFRSRRSSAGWTTRDMTAFGPAAGEKVLIQPSADGSSVLISTTLSLSPEDLNNPTNNTNLGVDLYLVRETGPVEFVSHGALPNRVEVHSTLCCSAPVANADLTAVAFQTSVPLSPEDPGGEHNCYVWQDVGLRLAHLTNPPINPPPPGGIASNCELFAVAGDGRAIVKEHPSGLLVIAGIATTASSSASLGGGAASFDALSPDDETAYVTTTEHLVANGDAGADIYAFNLRQTTSNAPPAVVCVSCEASGVPSVGDATWAGQSGDGAHVFFRLANGDLYEHDSGGSRLVAPAADGLSHLVFSHNGQHVLAITSEALSPSDTNGRPDVYEFTGGSSPRLITDGVAEADSYTPVAVSDSGERVLYEKESPGGYLINEWVAGQTGVITPDGATRSGLRYEVMGTAGPELEDVIFEANQPMVGQDLNAGTTDIYDARIGGGFPAPTVPSNETETPNPVGPTVAAFTGNLAPPNVRLAALPPDTSHPGSALRPKPLTRAQKLAKALKACKKDKSKSKRTKCEKEARKKYGTKSKAKKSPSKKGGS
jgi:hypothetical protein